MKDLSKRIEEIAVELVKVRSVVDTEGEVAVSEKVYEILSSFPYFREHPENLKFVAVKDDVLGRKSVMAILEGGKSSDTVVTIGHTDTVGVSDYGALIDYATDPYELTERIKSMVLPEAVKKDAESGDYLFGRGLFDMKTGDAILIAIIEYLSENLSELPGNMIYLAVCDEEGNSSGMLNCVPELVKLKKERNYNYLALLDTDYMTSEYEGDENKYIYVGTVGKIMPSFYVVGKETHVGESFKGLDPNQLAAALVDRINLNPEFCDSIDGEVSLPPISLKFRDLKPEYSVQVAKTTNVFFNYATHSSNPDEIMKKMVKAAEECFEQTLEKLNGRYKEYCRMAKRPYQELPFKPRALSYETLLSEVEKEIPDIRKKVEEYADSIKDDKNLDPRDKSMKIVEFLQSQWSDQNPVIIVYFTPPYYPHIIMNEKTPKGKRLFDAVKDAVNDTETGYKVVYKKFFPYISDLSYGAAPEDDSAIRNFEENTPGYGYVYSLPLKDMQELNLEVLDIGPFGKDAHKFTERIETEYSFKVAPELTFRTIMNLFRK